MSYFNSVFVQAKQARFLGIDVSEVPQGLVFEELREQFSERFERQLWALKGKLQECVGVCFICGAPRSIVQCMPCQHRVCFECLERLGFKCCQPIQYLQEPTAVIQLQGYQPQVARLQSSKTVPDLLKAQIHQQISPKTLLKLLRENDFTIVCTGYTIIEAQPHDFAIYDFVLNIANCSIKFFKRYSDFRRLARYDRYLEKIPQGKWWFFGGNYEDYIAERKTKLQSWLFRQLKGSNNQSVELARFICCK